MLLGKKVIKMIEIDEKVAKKIQKMEKIRNKMVEKMRKYGEFGVKLKDGSYFFFYGNDFVITYDTVTDHVIIEGYRDDKIMFENWIKVKNIKDIYPSKEGLRRTI